MYCKVIIDLRAFPYKPKLRFIRVSRKLNDIREGKIRGQIFAGQARFTAGLNSHFDFLAVPPELRDAIMFSADGAGGRMSPALRLNANLYRWHIFHELQR